MLFIRCPHCDHQIPDDPALTGRPDSCPACDRRFLRPLPIAKPIAQVDPVVAEMQAAEHRTIQQNREAVLGAGVVTLMWLGGIIFCIWGLCCGGCFQLAGVKW
jgi:hypothetical protein